MLATAIRLLRIDRLPRAFGATKRSSTANQTSASRIVAEVQ